MDPQEKDYIRSFYESALERYGISPWALHWNSASTQQARFEALSCVGDWHGASILDVGCGLGDLYQFLQESVGQFSYVGCDISPRMVEAARTRFPGGHFVVRDILEEAFPAASFDYVVASGTFSIRTKGHDEFLRDMIRTMYALCAKGTAFNLLERNPFEYDEEFFYSADPQEVLQFCRTLSNNIVEKKGYLWGDFTVFMYRDERTD